MATSTALNLIGVQYALWVAGMAAEAVLLGNLFTRRLTGRFPFFFLYMFADLAWGIALIPLGYQTRAYALAYRFYLITMCVLKLGVAAELYERICEHFRGIGNFRVYLAAVLVIIGSFIGVASFAPGSIKGFPESIAIAIERFETVALLGLLVLTRLVLYHFLRIRPPIRPNVMKHWMLLICYFGVAAGAFAVTQVIRPGPAVVYVNIAMLTFDLFCVSLWAKELKPAGEELPEVYRWSREGQARKEALRRAIFELAERSRDDFLHRL